MLEVLRQEYVNTARAKGLRESLVIYRHALRNAMIPTVTMVGIQFGTLLGGAVIVETVFARQGLGRLIVTGNSAEGLPHRAGRRAGHGAGVRRRQLPGRSDVRGARSTHPSEQLIVSSISVCRHRPWCYAGECPKGILQPGRRRWATVLSSSRCRGRPRHPGLHRDRDRRRAAPGAGESESDGAGPMFAPPGRGAILGTDQFGRDMLSRILYRRGRSRFGSD